MKIKIRKMIKSKIRIRIRSGSRSGGWRAFGKSYS